MSEVLLTPDVCMRFLVWAYYYHNIRPQRGVSFAVYKKFSAVDVQRLDQIQDALFKCFEEESVENACRQFQMAKMYQEPCPFSQTELDAMFAKEL